MKRNQNKIGLDVLTEAGGYWCTNYRIVQHFRGFNEAIILGYLCSMEKYWKIHKGLTEDGFFYLTAEQMESDLKLEKRTQRKAIRNLVERKLIDYELRPTKNRMQKIRHFKINTDELIKFLENVSIDNE